MPTLADTFTDDVHPMPNYPTTLLLILTASLPSLLAAQTATPEPLPPAQAAPAQPPWLQTVRALAIARLDTELRYARERHVEDSQPLPAAVREFMRDLLPDELLAQARYTVSVDAPTLPALLNRGHRELLDQDHAVSVPDLIIFSREPTFASAADARWWGHELAHLLQYRRWGGTEAFAQRYVDDFQAVEREAEALGQQALRRYVERNAGTAGAAATIAAPTTGAAAR